MQITLFATEPYWIRHAVQADTLTLWRSCWKVTLVSTNPQKSPLQYVTYWRSCWKRTCVCTDPQKSRIQYVTPPVLSDPANLQKKPTEYVSVHTRKGSQLLKESKDIDQKSPIIRVSLARGMTCNLRQPICRRHPVSTNCTGYCEYKGKYRVAKTHRIPYLYRSFSAKVTYI